MLLALSLAACGGGHTSSVPAALPGNAANPESTARSTTGAVPMVSVPKTFGELAYTDSGRRASNAPVNVSITLRYNNQAALDQFVADVSNPHSSAYGHVLTAAQFNSMYAPTAEQEASVIRGLQSAGFTITQRFPNRTIVDATAPSATVERFFSTEMHTVQQGKYGQRFANLKPATVPNTIAPVIRDVSLTNLVVVRTKVDQEGGVTSGSARVRTPAVYKIPATQKRLVRTGAANVVSDPGFESGRFTYWAQCGNVNARITTAKPHTGSYSEWSGTATTEPRGDAGVCQQVTVPASGQLSFWVWQSTNETSTTYSYQEADLLDSSGFVLDNLYTTVGNGQAWIQKSYNLAAYAGQTVYLYFGVHGDGTPGYHDLQYVDDVSLTNGGRNADADAGSDRDAQADGNADGDAQADRDAGPDSNADRGADGDPRADRHADGRSDRNPDARRRVQRRRSGQRPAHELERNACNRCRQAVRLSRSTRLQRRRLYRGRHHRRPGEHELSP